MHANDAFKRTMRWPQVHELIHMREDFLNAPVRLVMSSDLVTAKTGTLVSKVAAMMSNEKIHHLPVVAADGSCIGIVSSSDLMQIQDKLTRLRNFDCEETNRAFMDSLLVEDIMTPDPVIMDAEAKIGLAIEILLENRHRSIVVKKGRECVGIVTPLDFIKYLYREDWLQ